MEPTSFLSVAKFLIQPAISASKWTYNKSRLIWFRLKTKRFWIDGEKALKAAQITLGGSVISAIPFYNFGSKKRYIAALRKNFDDSDISQIFLLEKVGGSYLEIWHSEELSFFDEDTFKVDDITGEGFKSITFAEESWGSGAGTRYLYIYSTQNNQLSEIIEQYNYSSAGTPDYFPEVKAGEDENIRQQLIDYAVTRGFLAEIELPDFTNPKFAIHRWHKENGEKLIGKIKTYRYEGEPNYGSSITEIAEIGDIRWVAYFKGALFRYDKSKNHHYVVFSPSWVYEWVTSFVADEKKIWFVCHGVPGLFLYNHESQTLNRFCGYDNSPIPEIGEISVGNKEFILYSEIKNKTIEILDLDNLMPCNSQCVFIEPHLPYDCFERRYKDNEIKLFNDSE